MPTNKAITIKADTGNLVNLIRLAMQLEAKTKKAGESDKERKSNERVLEQN